MAIICVFANGLLADAPRKAAVVRGGRQAFPRVVLASEYGGMESEFQGLTVMVIDDSKTIRRSAEALLKKAGCEVVTVEDGFAALAKIVETRPSIIFVDVMMPRLDGYQTCQLIKHNPEFKKTPVVMLSSKDGLFDKAKGRVVGAEQYVTKPFTKDELLGAIKRYVIDVRG